MSENGPVIRILDDGKDHPLIGQGNTAEIYNYSEKVILKLFREGMPQDTVEREARCAESIGGVFPDTPAAARLSEWLTEHERDQLLRFIRKRLAKNGPMTVRQ